MAKQQAFPDPIDAIAQQLNTLSREQLLEVQAMLEVLLSTKIEGSELELEDSSAETHQGPKRGKGHIETKMIPDLKRGKMYGPYRYLRYWQAGKLKTRYLGKAKS